MDRLKIKSFIMKNISLLVSLFISASLIAQRPATRAETEEDARVLKILSAAMPHNPEGAEESERSNGHSSLEGITGFHNDRNFVTRDAFDHQYTITYEYTRVLPAALKEKIEAAKDRNDMEYVLGSSSCEIQVYVNSFLPESSLPYSLSPVKKISSSYCNNTYRDANGRDFTFLFFGKNWSVNPVSSPAEDEQGKPQTRYTMKTTLSTHPGTDIQGIFILVKSTADLADIFFKQIDWEKINGLLGTGKIQDDETESALKKYFPEKPVAPVAGNNSLSFTYVDEKGVEKQFVINSSKHDLSNGARLRNHNENPKLLQDAHIDLSIRDDKDPNKLFSLSLPIIRTTGTVTATFQSDYDYQIMWRGNPDVNHSFTATAIGITLLNWAPVGDFLEGTFQGTATLNDHNDFSTEKPAYTIKNGTFRIRRITDEIR
jgi:hypothetical protein